MNSTHRASRPLLLIGIASIAIVLVSSGCGWIRDKTNYQGSREANPLEIPPEMDRPDTSAATALPIASTAGPTISATAAGRFSVPASEAYPKVGELLASEPGVVINGRAEALSSFDVSYKGESFLLRVLDSTGGSRLVALSADGRMLTGGAAAELIATIKSKF